MERSHLWGPSAVLAQESCDIKRFEVSERALSVLLATDNPSMFQLVDLFVRKTEISVEQFGIVLTQKRRIEFERGGKFREAQSETRQVQFSEDAILYLANGTPLTQMGMCDCLLD